MEFSNETFFNINFKDPFTRVPNSILDNKNLSYSAIGILTQILRFQNSKEYKIYAKTLISYRKDGKTKVENALKELIKEGFVIRTKLRNEKGHIKGYRYDVFDTPQTNKDEVIKNEEFLPCADLPTTVKTEDGKNRNRINRDRKNSNIKENINKENINKENINKENINTYSPSDEKTGKNTSNLYYAMSLKGRSLDDLSRKMADGRSPHDLQVGREATSNNTNINNTNLTNNIYSTAEQKEDKTNNKEIHKRIIDYLNEKADKSFKSTTKKTISLIDVRFKEGFKEEDFYKVIENKVYDWLTDSKMSDYLRPETLFGNKFESYLNEAPKTSKKSNESVEVSNKKYTKKNNFQNFDETFKKYSDSDLNDIIKKSQKIKYGK